MTQEAFKAWWYNEGSQAPYTHHDCEEHTMRMCEIAWANGAYKALTEHAMREVQRLGQEIEQEPVAWQWLGSAHFRKKLPKNADITAWNPLYTTPPQRTERNFCERCGKRTKDIHTCTPPQEDA